MYLDLWAWLQAVTVTMIYAQGIMMSRVMLTQRCPREEMCIDEVKAFGDNDVTGDNDPALSPRPRHYLVFGLFPMKDSGKVKRAQVK